MSNRELIEVPIFSEDGKEVKKVKIFIKNPSNEVVSMADRHRAKTFNHCILDGIMTKPELEKAMNERGLWDKDKDAKHDELTSKIVAIEKDLYLGDGKARTLKEGQDLAIEIRGLRIELRDLISQKVALEENTAEAIADNARFDYLVAFCTYYETGEKVYKTIDEYNSKSSDSISFIAAAKLAEMMYNVDPNFEKKLPENLWLSENGLTNEEGSLINDKGELVDPEGRRIDEQGRFIDDDGQWVDQDGNKLADDGRYVPQAEYKSTKKTTRSRKRTAKKTESVE